MSRAQRRGRGSDRTVEGAEAGDLLAALADEDCRTLLQAADGEALSTSELSDACELPLSTTYRKVERLTEAGLFEEQLRLCSSGKHTSEYTLAIQSVELSLSDEGIDIELSTGESEEPRAGTSVLAGAD
jgi:hypothetical protein